MKTISKWLAVSYLAIAMLIVGLSTSTQASENFPNTMNYEGVELRLNGQGTRTMFSSMKIYESGLYLMSGSNDPEKIISEDSAMGVRMEVISAMLSAEKMKYAFNKSLINSTQNNTQPIADQIEQFMASFETVSAGDIWKFIYLPQSGLHVLRNSELRTIVSGLEFKKALLGVWLSDNSVQESLKKEMLGN